MLKHYAPFLALLAIVTMAGGCTSRLTKFPEGEVSSNGILEFEFSRDMMPQDSLQTWVSTPYFEFDPPITGLYQWRNPRLLRFNSDEALPDNQHFTAKATSHLPGIAEGDLPTVHFHTELFQPQAVMLQWRDEYYYSDHTAPASATLVFNHPVEPDSLKKYLKIYRGDKPLEDYTVYSYYAEENIEVVWDEKEYLKAAQEYRFVLGQGLASTVGDAVLLNDTTITALLKPVRDLEINDVDKSDGQREAYVELTANQRVDMASLSEHLKIEPHLPFALEPLGSRVRINADFKPGSKYTIHLSKGLKGLAGGTLHNDFKHTIVFPSLEPFVRFADYSGMYMLRNGLENLRVQSTNTDKFDLKLYEVYENNLVHFLDDNYSLVSLDSYYGDAMSYYYDYFYGPDIDNYGRLITAETVAVKQVPNVVQTTVVHVDKHLKSRYRGIFVVTVSDQEDSWHEHGKIVCLSDLGIIARRKGGELIVFVNSLSNAMPVGGAQVSIISETNQTLYSATTDGDGVARFRNIEGMGDGFDPRLILASTGADFNFLDLEHTRIETDRFDLGGKSVRDIDAYAWSDRNLYRPGDSVFLACIVRNWDYSTPNGVPLVVKVVGPDGEMVADQKHIASQDGAFTATFPLPMGMRTGESTAEIYLNEELVTSLRFHVEDFVPDKILVAPKALAPLVRLGDTAQVGIHAEYYFGAPCDSHAYEGRVNFWPGAYQSKRYKEFSFANPSEDALSEVLFEGTLDAKGYDTVEVPIPSHWRMHGPVFATAYATVYDNSGRTVTRKASFTIQTQQFYLGMRSYSGEYMSPNDELRFDLVAVNKDDAPAASFPVVVRIERRLWKNALRNTSSGMQYVSDNVGEVVYQDTLTQQGAPLAFRHRLREPGTYSVHVRRPGGTDELYTEVLVYGKGSEYTSSFGTEREGTIHITTDKQAYNSGENARIHFATPFSGRMLVTLERDRLYRHYYVNVPRNSAEISVPLTDEFLPNIVVTATLFHPMRGSSPMPFTVSHGYASLKVDQPARNLPVKIDCPAQSEPGKRAWATVRTAPGALVTLAVVDEGILAIKQFETPNPYPYFYAERVLEVDSYDMYKFLLPEVVAQNPTTGGDGSSGYAGLNPFQVRRFRPMAIWSGIVRADGGGVARIPLDVHAGFNGKVRLMAVAWRDKRFGAGEASMKVHGELVIQPSIPRFLLAGDSLRIPVHILNTTEDVHQAKVRLEVSGPVKLLGPAEMDVKILGKGTAKGEFRVACGTGIGKAKFKVVATYGKRTMVHEEVLAVQAPGQTERHAGNGQIVAGQSAKISLPSGYHPETQMGRIRVSNFPATELGAHLRDLLLYPHGCAEQTVSKLFPQLYFGEMAELMAPELYEKDNAVIHVREGIHKLEAMQNYSGGFNYWPDGGYVNDWASVYAMHFLLEARKAGYPIRDETIERGVRYLKEQTTGSATFTYSFTRRNQHFSATIAPKERIYALYVLAMAGSPDLSLMNYYKAHVEEMAGDSRFMLAAAYALTGDQNSFHALIPKQWEPEYPDRQTGGSFDSEVRPSGIMLNALLDADPGHPYVPKLLEQVAQTADKLYSTQDKAWAFLGLGKAARGQAANQMQIEIVQDGKVVASGDGKGVRHDGQGLPGKTVEIRVKGKGKAYYSWEAEGVPQGAGLKARKPSNGLRITRHYYDTQGNEILQPVFRQGELVVVQVRLTGMRTAENIALTDLIPAGMEVENQRISHLRYDWIKAPVRTLDNQDVRDDRIVTYTGCEKGQTVEFNYLMRAVNPGSFRVPPIGAEAMYDPRICGYADGLVVRILRLGEQLPAGSRVKAKAKGNAVAGGEERLLTRWWEQALSQARP